MTYLFLYLQTLRTLLPNIVFVYVGPSLRNSLPLQFSTRCKILGITIFIRCLIKECFFVKKRDGSVRGESMPLAGLYPGLKRPRLDYPRVYYGLGQLIPRSILWPRPINIHSGQIIPSLYQPRYQ